MAVKNQTDNSLDFQICKYCDHENICIPNLNVLDQISLSQEFKNIFFFRERPLMTSLIRVGTLESGIEVGPTVINLAFFSRPYGLIRDYIKVI